jgi:O-antigen/teichoic acid export membrane protein
MLKNIFYSFGINFVNFLFPILLTPFYVKTLGLNNFGLITLIFGIVNIISVITEYSWNILGPLEIHRLKHQGKSLNQYISTVAVCKILLFLGAALLLAATLLTYKFVKGYELVSISIFVYLLSRSHNTHWIFLGIDKIKFYLINNTFCRISCLACIFFFVKGPDDFHLVFYFLGVFEILQFVGCYVYIYFKIKYRFCPVLLEDIKNEMTGGFKMFLTNLSVCALINSGTLILGLYFNPAIIAVYGIADKVISLSKHTVGVLFQGVFPYLSKKYIESKTLFYRLIKIQFKIYLVIYTVGVLIIIFFADFLVSLLSNVNIEESAHYLRFLAPIPLIMALGQSSYIELILKDKKSIYSMAYFIGFIINITATSVLAYFFGLYGVIISLVLTELFITGFLTFNNLKLKKRFRND